MSIEGEASTAAISSKYFSNPAGVITSSTVAGVSPAFQKAWGMPRGLCMTDPGPATWT
jgi:hypothetical protein